MISQRVLNTQAPPLVELGEMAHSHPDCISLGQGAPFYSPPSYVIDEFKEKLHSTTIHRYTSDPGLPSFRQMLSTKLESDQKISTTPDQLVVTPGANQAFYNVLQTIADPGDEIILLTPYYFNHFMACSMLNIRAHLVPLTTNFQIDFDLLNQSITTNTKATVVVNPGNPTGMVHTRDDLETVVELADRHDLLIIADETYEYFTYTDQSHIPLANLNQDRVISLGSFSKTFGIPGWRLGYYSGPVEIIEQSIKVQDTIGICAPHSSQILGKILLKYRDKIIPSFVDYMSTNYSLSKDLCDEVKWLQNTPSGGAYYLFPEQKTGVNTMKLVKELITDFGVYIVPGEGFGKDWDTYFRISFANVKPEELKEAFTRLRSYS